MDPLSLMFSILWLAHFDYRERPTRTANRATHGASVSTWNNRGQRTGERKMVRAAPLLSSDTHQLPKSAPPGLTMLRAGFSYYFPILGRFWLFLKALRLAWHQGGLVLWCFQRFDRLLSLLELERQHLSPSLPH